VKLLTTFTVTLVGILSIAASAQEPTHVAFAYGPMAKIATYGTGTDSVSAQAAAESACRQQGGGSDCQGIGWWRYGYASFALNASTGNWGWGTDPYDITMADSRALDWCGSNCMLIYRLGIGGSAPFEWDNLSPVRGNFTIEGFTPGQCDHKGRDLYAVDFFSDAPAVYPVQPGQVVFSAWNCQTDPPGQMPCYGNTVAVDHGGGIYSIYTHLDPADKGRPVTSQTRIGTMSNSGCPVSICGSRPHLHFAVRSGPPNLGENALYGSDAPILTPWTLKAAGTDPCGQ
jgi:murein DD-endopeptidase MepM/ murein hydrolase activator NlpD